jgi:hypothetical protein
MASKGKVMRSTGWQNFIKRYPEISTKLAICFDAKRDDWCTLENFEKMYAGIYAAMVRSQVAIQLPEKVMVRLDGRITESSEEKYGRETNFLLTQNSYFSSMR